MKLAGRTPGRNAETQEVTLGMEKKIRWGLLGASNIAKEWLCAAINNNPDCEAVSVFSTSAKRGTECATALGLKRSYTDLNEFLSDPEMDAVYISTTNERHRDESIAAAQAGKHILCEKPLALSVKDAQAMVEAAKRANVVIATNHHLRNMETHRAIKDVIKSGEIGRITSARIGFTVSLPESLARWRLHVPAAGAGVALDLTVHDMDTLRYYFDVDPISVTGMAITSGEAAEGVADNMMTVWEFPGKVLVVCQDSFLVPYGGTAIEFHGLKGSIRGDDVLWQKPQGQVIVTTELGRREIKVEHKIPYDRTIEDFVAAVRGKGEPSVSGSDGLASLLLTLAALEAIETGRKVRI
jgi:1,5-anhydro-D-fructose reductase (1,5-anhydro-D-mannitol-forming)